MVQDFFRLFGYALEFYIKKINMLVIFSVPFILSFLVLIMAPAPTYVALGGAYIRIGSLPDLSVLQIMLTIITYAISMFLIADTIVNINLIIKSKRTLTQISSEVFKGMQEYGMSIFLILTIMVLLMFTVQLITYDLSVQPLIFPLFSFILSFFLFFVPPAIVIDDSSTADAIARSISMAARKWHLILLWALFSLILLSVTKVVGDFIFRSYSPLFVLLVNSLFILPFMIVLQTQMYMEKYPLAK